MFSAHSSHPSNSTSASLWSTPSASSNLGPGNTPTTCANFTTPFVSDAVQCFKSSKGFSFTFVSRTSCTASICAFQFCSSMLRCFSILRTASLFFWMSTSCEALFTVRPFTSSRNFRMSRLCSPRPLYAAHPEVKGAEAARGLCAAELRLLLHCADLLESLLLLLADVVLQASLGVGHITLEV